MCEREGGRLHCGGLLDSQQEQNNNTYEKNDSVKRRWALPPSLAGEREGRGSEDRKGGRGRNEHAKGQKKRKRNGKREAKNERTLLTLLIALLHRLVVHTSSSSPPPFPQTKPTTSCTSLFSRLTLPLGRGRRRRQPRSDLRGGQIDAKLRLAQPVKHGADGRRDGHRLRENGLCVGGWGWVGWLG